MLELDSPDWKNLSHAYGKASDIPVLLHGLEAGTFWINDNYQESEPWFSLWSALCHQGDVYTASYAAVPHLIRIAIATQGVPDWQYFSLPTSIEIARLTGRGPQVPGMLAEAYFAALRQFHTLVTQIAHLEWDELLSRSIAAALVVSKGHAVLAETILELSPDSIKQFRQYQGLDADDEE